MTTTVNISTDVPATITLLARALAGVEPEPAESSLLKVTRDIASQGVEPKYDVSDEAYQAGYQAGSEAGYDAAKTGPAPAPGDPFGPLTDEDRLKYDYSDGKIAGFNEGIDYAVKQLEENIGELVALWHRTEHDGYATEANDAVLNAIREAALDAKR